MDKLQKLEQEVYRGANRSPGRLSRKSLSPVPSISKYHSSHEAINGGAESNLAAKKIAEQMEMYTKLNRIVENLLQKVTNLEENSKSQQQPQLQSSAKQ